MRAEQITDPVAHHGEGPVWDDALGVLHFVDMLAGDLLSFAPESAVVHRRHLASVLAAVRPRRAGGLVLAVERGFALLDSLDAPVEFLEPLWSDPGMRMNEGGCDPAGGFYCGGMATTDDADAATGRAALYRLSPDLHTRPALAAVTISNGLAWAPDGSFAYYVDSPTQRIDRVVFDPESGVVTERRPFATIPAESGAPDGLTVDAEGGVWTALFGGGELRELAASTLASALREAGSVKAAPGTPYVDLLVDSGLVKSKGEARRAIGEGGAYLNNERVTDPELVPGTEDLLDGGWLVLRRGKRNFAGVEIS